MVEFLGVLKMTVRFFILGVPKVVIGFLGNKLYGVASQKVIFLTEAANSFSKETIFARSMAV